MKRDMELVRRILLRVEDLAPGQTLEPESRFEDVDPLVYDEHVWLMAKAGFLRAERVSAMGDAVDQYIIECLTWDGHEFLNAIRHEGVWAKIQAKAAEEGGNLPLTLIRELGTSYLKEKLGL